MKAVTPDDLRNLSDPNADPVDRVQALSRLAHWEKGKYNNLEPTIAGLIADDPSSAVRGGAIKTLLSGWKREKYFELAIQMLHTDTDADWIARADAAYALSAFAKYTGKGRDRVIRELAKAVRDDDAWPVQQRCYEELLELLAPDHEANFSGEFNRDRDVDWNLLSPYLAE